MNRAQHGTTVVNYRLKLEELKKSFANLKAQRDRDERRLIKAQADLQTHKVQVAKQQSTIKSLTRQNTKLATLNQQETQRLQTANEHIRKLEAKLVCGFQAGKQQHQHDHIYNVQQTVVQQEKVIEEQRERLGTYEATIEATV